MNWFDQNNWTAFQAQAHKSLFQPWKNGAAPAMPSMSRNAATQPDAAQDGLSQMNELIRRSMEGWAMLAQPGSPKKGKHAGIDPTKLAKLFDPGDWGKAMSSGFDMSLNRMTEGPTYATLTDLDRKVASAQKLWLRRAKDSQDYQLVVQAAWARASEQFTRSLNDSTAPPLKSARAVLDLWLSVANEALLEMHHRPEFLDAQRRMTRSAAEYRLQEQELAEAFCTAHHIPTRTEMDEVQRTMHELKRELRALKRLAAKGARA